VTTEIDTLPRSAAGPYSPWLIAWIVSIATFMETLDITVANVALPHIAGSVGASADESTYVITSYLVSNALILTISGWLADVVGRKRFYMISVAFFTISSLMCALSTSLSMIVIFRCLQGIGGGGLAPVEQSILVDSFPESKRGRAFAVYGLVVITAPVIGPWVGGWLTDNLSWRWVFLINIPVGILSLALTSVFVSDSPQTREDRRRLLEGGLAVDYVGFALVTIGLGSLQIVLDRFAREDGFDSGLIVFLSIVAAISLLILCVWELRHPYPVVDLRLFRNRSFALSTVVMFAINGVMISTSQLLPQMTQLLLHYDATTAGLVMSLGGIFTLFLAPVAGGLSGNVLQPRMLIAAGLLGAAWSMWRATGFDLDVSFTDVALVPIIQTMSIPFVLIPLGMIQYVGVPSHKTNDASAIVNSVRNLGGGFGLSVVTNELVWGAQRHQVYLGAHVTPYDGYGYGHSLTQIWNAVSQQATMLSYLDVFRLLMVAALCLVPLALFLPKMGKAPAFAH
jgi:MFS transporter, DHA2 family, multidrug resistance protein